MVDTTIRPAAAEEAAAGAVRHSHVDWPAIFAGAAFATAISFLLSTFGAAIGLSIPSLLTGEASAIAAIIGVGLWTVWVAVSSFMAGAYLTGRMRRRTLTATPHEVQVRDGIHGLVVWAVGTLIGAVIAASALAGAARTAADVTTEAVSAIGSVASGVAGDVQTGYLVDRLFRAEGDPVTVPSSLREQVGRIVAEGGVSGGIAEDDSSFLSEAIASRTGLSQEEAAARVQSLNAEVQAAIESAAEAANAARQLAVVTAFTLAASLLIAAAGAWWAAGMGGRHRDDGIEFGWLVGRPRR